LRLSLQRLFFALSLVVISKIVNTRINIIYSYSAFNNTLILKRILFLPVLLTSLLSFYSLTYYFYPLSLFSFFFFYPLLLIFLFFYFPTYLFHLFIFFLLCIIFSTQLIIIRPIITPYNINLNSLAFWFWKASIVNEDIKIRDTNKNDYWLKSSTTSATIDLYLVNIVRVS